MRHVFNNQIYADYDQKYILSKPMRSVCQKRIARFEKGGEIKAKHMTEILFIVVKPI